MWNNFIGSQMARCNRNLLQANLVLLFAVILVSILSARYLYNFVLGPFSIDHQTLEQTVSPDLLRYFVHVKGDETMDTGFQHVDRRIDKYTKEVKREETIASYLALAIGQRLLLVKAPPYSTGKEFTGGIEVIPIDLEREFINKLQDRKPEFRGVFLPFMLDATGFRQKGYGGLAIGIPLFVLSLWNLYRVKKRKQDPEVHPIVRSLKRFGQPEDIAGLIERELESVPKGTPLGSVRITPSWLLHSRTFGLKVIHLSEVVWVYKKVTKRSVNFIPVGKSYGVVVWNRDGKSTEIGCSQVNSDKILGEIIYRVPWVFAGFNKQMDVSWKKNRPAFIRAVDERKGEVAKRAQK